MKKLTLALSTAGMAMAALTVSGMASTAFAGDKPAAMPDPMGGMTVTRADAEAMAGKMFDRMDANHDGKIDKADREARTLEHFRSMDTDGNGSISQAEFVAGHQHGEGREAGKGDRDMPGHDMGGGDKAGWSHGGHDRMGMMILHHADANGDMAVSRDEFLAAARSHFDKIDTNHDGKVTPEERHTAMKAMRAMMKGHMKAGMNHEGMEHGGDGPPPPAH